MQVKKNQEELIMFLKDLLSLNAGFVYIIDTIDEKFCLNIGKKVDSLKVQEEIYQWLKLRCE